MHHWLDSQRIINRYHWTWNGNHGWWLRPSHTFSPCLKTSPIHAIPTFFTILWKKISILLRWRVTIPKLNVPNQKSKPKIVKIKKLFFNCLFFTTTIRKNVRPAIDVNDVINHTLNQSSHREPSGMDQEPFRRVKKLPAREYVGNHIFHAPILYMFQCCTSSFRNLLSTLS